MRGYFTSALKGFLWALSHRNKRESTAGTSAAKGKLTSWWKTRTSLDAQSMFLQFRSWREKETEGINGKAGNMWSERHEGAPCIKITLSCCWFSPVPQLRPASENLTTAATKTLPFSCTFPLSSSAEQVKPQHVFLHSNTIRFQAWRKKTGQEFTNLH